MTPLRHRRTFAAPFRVQRFTLLDDMQYERINVVGTSGSGKSSLSHQIATHLDLPYIELDQLFWKADWTETPDEEFFQKLKVALSADRWVLDGNYDRTRHIKQAARHQPGRATSTGRRSNPSCGLTYRSTWFSRESLLALCQEV